LIKIRYADLPAGLHVRAEAQGRSTIVYLLPGLTPAERRAALGRVRRNAGLGHGPKLPAAGIVAAVMADRVKATLRNGAAAFRTHPLLLLPPLIIAVTATLLYIMLAAVTITVSPPQAGGPAGPVGAVPEKHHHPRPGPSAAPGRIGNLAGPAPSGQPGSGGPSRSPRPARSPGRSRSPSPSPSAAPTVSASGSPSSAPSAHPPRSPGPVSSPPAGTPTPTPSPSPTTSEPCLRVGPLGVCLKL
jgi:hypothetical protein